MVSRADFQVRLLEKIATPLLAAIIDVSVDSQDSQESLDAAKITNQLASLLNRAVHLGIEMSAELDIKTQDDGDAVRLGLAAMSGPLVADLYRSLERVPEEAEVRRLSRAMQAVMTFSDNFVAAAETAARLDNLTPGDLFEDEKQIYIQYMGALVPVVDAVMTFSFGRPDQRLIQEISTRLIEKAESMRAHFLGDHGSARDIKRTELGFLRSLAQLYASCHESETARLLTEDIMKTGGGLLPMDDVWAQFERGAAMLLVIAESSGAASSDPSPAAAAPVAAATSGTADTVHETDTMAAEDVLAGDVPSGAPDEESGGDDAGEDDGDEEGNFNPMSFFKTGGN